MLLIDIRVRYLLLIILVFLSFLHYLHNPLKHSDAIECFGIQCRQFILLFNLISFTFLSSMIISMSILNKSIFIPTYWFIPLIILGYTIIILDWRLSKIVIPRKGKITPPPLNYIPKLQRFIISMVILILYMFLFVTNFAAHRIKPIDNSFSEVVILSSFGGFREKSGACMTGWLSLLGIITSAINIYFTEKFIPGNFDLPNSWRI